jgi:maintenance of morphology protein 1
MQFPADSDSDPPLAGYCWACNLRLFKFRQSHSPCKNSPPRLGMAYVLTLTPTFTQGFILGQLSILVILALILKYLFLDSSLEPVSSPSLAPSVVERRERIDAGLTNEKPKLPNEESIETLPALEDGKESTEWFNLIIQEVRV